MDLENLKYPIGRFYTPTSFTPEEIKNWIADIESLPERLAKELSELSEVQLNTPYRPGGWTVIQVVHHMADSHMNGFIRTKLALTEDNPTIKPYEEALWAEKPDGKMDIQPSLEILKGVHKRWAALLKTLNINDLDKTFFHPEHQKSFYLKTQIANYAWHSNHHLAHVKLVSGK